jgi:hypothetical protein
MQNLLRELKFAEGKMNIKINEEMPFAKKGFKVERNKHNEIKNTPRVK